MAYDPPLYDEVDFEGPAGALQVLDFDGVDFPLAEAAEPYVGGVGLSVSIVRRYQASLPLVVSMSDARVFDSSVGKVTWSARVIIGGVDLSSRLGGALKIDAEEDAARIASFSLTPVSAAQLAALEGATVSIDITVTGGGYSATRRRFTGVVESAKFSAAMRVADVICRDGYQDRIRSASGESAVRALFGGLETVSPKIVAWNDDEPDAAGYFAGALATVPGATFIDGAGAWRIAAWNIGAPARIYTAADMFDPGPVVETARRGELPSSVVATLTHRFPRLHNVELPLNWEEPDRVNYVTRGILSPMKSMVAQALENLGDWVIKGTALLESPLPGSYPVASGIAGATFYIVTHEAAPLMIRTLSAVAYRRWYQEIERRFQVTVSLGGLSGRDESVSRAIKSEFDASRWEDGRKSEPSLGIYTANPPAGSEDDPELTGYEALQEPWPPFNSATDYFADLSTSDVQQACRHVIAEATRKAALWRRRQRVSFERPADLRIELGDVAEYSAYGVGGKGQVAAWSETYDFDSAECIGRYTFAAPVGSGDVTGFSATVAVPSPSITHALSAPSLNNWIGADSSTPDAWIDPDLLAGYLCNTLPTSDFYDADKPTYETQFRIVLPEIPAPLRDPASELVEIDAEIDLADAGLTITF